MYVTILYLFVAPSPPSRVYTLYIYKIYIYIYIILYYVDAHRNASMKKYVNRFILTIIGEIIFRVQLLCESKK